MSIRYMHHHQIVTCEAYVTIKMQRSHDMQVPVWLLLHHAGVQGYEGLNTIDQGATLTQLSQ